MAVYKARTQRLAQELRDVNCHRELLTICVLTLCKTPRYTAEKVKQSRKSEQLSHTIDSSLCVFIYIMYLLSDL